MSDMSGAILSAVAQLGTDLRAEIEKSRADTARLIEGIQTSLDAIRDDITVLGGTGDRERRKGENTRDEVRDLANGLADIQRVLLKHGTRLDALERRGAIDKEG
jgi:hypothetical protein